MSRFLSEKEILEALEEEMDDSGSEWEMSECEENEEDSDTGKELSSAVFLQYCYYDLYCPSCFS